jgi:RNA polymerase sigma-70 factor (ECF subfamily)
MSSDLSLFDRYHRSRDVAAFGAILDRHQADLLRMANALLGDGHAAQDAVQEGFLRLSREGDKLLAKGRIDGEGTGSLGDWLCTVVRNCCLDQLRRRRVAPMLSLHDHQDDQHGDQRPPPATEVAEREAGEVLWGAVAGLPPLERAAVVLRYRDGMSYQDIAERLGKTATHIGVLLHQGLGRLRNCTALKAGVQP